MFYIAEIVQFILIFTTLQEALASPSPLSPTDGNDSISPTPAANTTSKKGNKRGPKKKATKKKGGVNNDGEVTPTSESPDLFFKLEEKMDIDQDGIQNPSSPSLPSSDSSSEDSDREDTIIQMKRRAEELKKKIKIEKKAVNKIKLAKEAKKANRGVTRMEVETISETETLLIELETGSPQKQVVQIIPPKTTEPKLTDPTPSDSKPPDAKASDVKQPDAKASDSKRTETSPEPKPESPQPVKSKPTRPTKLSRLKKIKSPSPEQVLSPTAESSPPPPLKIKKVEIPEDSSFLPVSKQTFKIPKKTGANTVSKVDSKKQQ